MTRARTSALRLLRLMMVGSVALPAVLFVFAAWLNYRAHFRFADEGIERSLDVLHEQALRGFQSTELAISTVDEVLRGSTDENVRANEEALHDRLKQIVGQVSQVQSIWVFARNGRPLLSSSVLPAPQSMDNSDRDYFRAQLAPQAGTYIGETISSRSGGDPVFTVSRRRPMADGTFAGVTVAALSSDEFHRFYAEIGRSPGSYSALLRSDGVFLARFPTPAQPAARLDEKSVLRQAIMRVPASGVFDAASQLDGVDRRIGYRKIPGYPLYVLAGIERATIIKEWWSAMSSHLIFGLPATALLFGVLALAMQRTQRLHAEAERRQAAEEALRQSQKMESIGQLTGGVAHDFNNLLTVVIGNLELAERSLDKSQEAADGRMRRLLQNAMQGAHRAANLTQRLLAFARRQPLKPEPVNGNELISGMSDLLHRALGETVQIEIVAAAGLWLVEADPIQLESALLNLAINARDAMPEGGKLTIETCNAFLDENYCRQHAELSPGQYVMLSVSDSGSGMTREVLDRAFEPFFTTKPAGQGTGLGLSQVYGFVKQSGGHVSLYSEPGHGSTIKVYLPRYIADVRPQDTRETLVPAGQGSETVLVVEDDADVRAYVVDALRQLNYVLFEAAEAVGATNLLERHGAAIDLLLTDVVLPGTNGRQLADEAQRRHSNLKVLFMTGYSRNAIVHQGKLDADVELIQKPFTQAALAVKVRSVLDDKARLRPMLAQTNT